MTATSKRKRALCGATYRCGDGHVVTCNRSTDHKGQHCETFPLRDGGALRTVWS